MKLKKDPSTLLGMTLYNIKMKHNPENGSAIIWILIAVALFAALNFAFNSGTRTSTSNLTDSEATAYANQIIAYGNEVKAAVKRLQLRGCDDTEISFENDVVVGYINPNAPDNKSCHVFDVAGGGLSVKSEFMHSFSGDIPFENVESSAPELSLQISNIDQSTCLKINSNLNLEDSNSDNYEDNVDPAPSIFIGTYGSVSVTDLSGDDVASLSRQKSYCRKDSSNNYYFMQTLLTR